MSTPGPEQHMVIIRTVGQWLAQAKEAWAEIEQAAAAAGRPEGEWKLHEAATLAPAAFSRFIEAAYAIGWPMDDETIRLAGLVPVDQAVIGDD